MLTLGVYIGLPVTVLVLAALTWTLVWLLRSYDDDERSFFVGATIVGIVATLVAFTVLWWPFNMDYHRWHHKGGTVETAERRLLGDGDNGMSEVFVVRFKDDPTLYRCDDTRCALATPGKVVRLLCKPVWEYAAVDGWACRYGQES